MITLSGVDCMNDDPSAVSVLYAKVSLKDSSARYGVYNIHSSGTKKSIATYYIYLVSRGCELDFYP